ncbi:MAG: hypothetical protein PWQ28_259 [Candidatus Woesearchaeota archaeon]|nr:hypothetical protein [Candidatus Woesearchaeota archaeon]
MDDDEFTKLMKQKYERRIKAALREGRDISDVEIDDSDSGIISKDYSNFIDQFAPPKLSTYEKLCKFCENIVKISPPKNLEKELKRDIETAHLNITPEGAMSFALLIPIFFIVAGLVVVALTGIITGTIEIITMLFFFVFGLLMIQPFRKIPSLLATKWRMRASNQMILCVFYVVTYLRHTSNLEAALRFAANHLTPPLSIDLKKMMWDVESGRYNTIIDALNDYLERWRGYNDEFIETFRVIESSLSEASNERRLESLDRAMSSILETTYDKMLSFAQNLKSPIDSLNMLGIVLPIMTLIILPLVGGLMPAVSWYHIAMIYNAIIPFMVFSMALGILTTRPTGYGGSGIEEEFIEGSRKKKVKINLLGINLQMTPLAISILLFIPLFLLGLSPLIIHAINPNFEIPIIDGIIYFMGYVPSQTGDSETIGPFGLGALILSFFIPVAVGLALGTYLKLSNEELEENRKESEVLEKEFESSLYLLSDRLSDGTSPEFAISAVSKTTTGSVVARFFSIMSDNIQRLGMGIDEAIFDKRRGAIAFYPSNIIESAMKIFTESIKRGLNVASRAMRNFAEYLKQIHRINERLKDILADVLSSIKSQMSFLTPLIGGIVVGITNLLSNVINVINQTQTNIGNQTATAPGMVSAESLQFFGIGIPSYFFQIVVGMFVVEIIIIMSYIYATIEKGEDSVYRGYSMGQNLIKGTSLYFIVGIVTSIMFSLLTIGIQQFMIA